MKWLVPIAMLALAVVGIAIAVVPVDAVQQQDVELVLYTPPMIGPIQDPFRPPAHIGARGNRGLQYGYSEGQGIRAAAVGQVLFAGQVGFRQVITVQHADGVKTTYTGLNEVWVTRGALVNRFTTMGIGSARFHFGARLGDHYLDPQILFDASEPTEQTRLIPPPS